MIKYRMSSLLVVMLMALSISDIAFAYIGPGAGVSLIGSFIGILAAVLIAIFALIAWPIRRMFKARKTQKKDVDPSNNTEPSE